MQLGRVGERCLQGLNKSKRVEGEAGWTAGRQYCISVVGVIFFAGISGDLCLAQTLSIPTLHLTPYNQEQAALVGILTDNQVINVTSLNIGATKEFRNGMTVAPTFLNTRATDNIYDIGGVNRTTFQVNVPLLRGRGRHVVAVAETAAGIEVEASLLDLNQTISSLLSNRSSGYWNAVSAAKSLKVVQESEERTMIYVENVQTLITAERVPQAEIHQARANLANRSAARITAEQSLIAAHQQLALAMGISTDKMPSWGTPEDDSLRTVFLAMLRFVCRSLRITLAACPARSRPPDAPQGRLISPRFPKRIRTEDLP